MVKSDFEIPPRRGLRGLDPFVARCAAGAAHRDKIPQPETRKTERELAFRFPLGREAATHPASFCQAMPTILTSSQQQNGPLEERCLPRQNSIVEHLNATTAGEVPRGEKML